MVHARILEEYIHYALMYTTDHNFPVLPTKDLIKKYSKPTTPFKLTIGKNLQYRIYACYFFCELYRKLMHTLTKGVTYVSPSAKVFRGIFVGIPQHQKRYLIYIPITWEIVSSHDVVFEESFSSEL